MNSSASCSPELGPLAFSARIRNVGMEAVVHALVDKAIMQRVAQVTNGGTDDGI